MPVNLFSLCGRRCLHEDMYLEHVGCVMLTRLNSQKMWTYVSPSEMQEKRYRKSAPPRPLQELGLMPRWL